MIMRARMLFALLACLAGCASGPYGNFTEHSTPALNQRLATDSARQLTALRPPASTRLQIGQEAGDGYGVALVRSLRAAGYSVQEFSPQAKPSSAANAPLLVNYIVDAPRNSNLYRVTLQYGRESISRAYIVQNDGLQPAGVWVRKE